MSTHTSSWLIGLHQICTFVSTFLVPYDGHDDIGVYRSDHRDGTGSIYMS